VPGLQGVSDPTAPFFPAPSLAFPDVSGTVEPEMCPKSRSMIRPAGAAALGPAEMPRNAQAATSPRRRVTVPVVAAPRGDRSTPLADNPGRCEASRS
jgi:hypothetical protein